MAYYAKTRQPAEAPSRGGSDQRIDVPFFCLLFFVEIKYPIFMFTIYCRRCDLRCFFLMVICGRTSETGKEGVHSLTCGNRVANEKWGLENRSVGPLAHWKLSPRIFSPRQNLFLQHPNSTSSTLACWLAHLTHDLPTQTPPSTRCCVICSCGHIREQLTLRLLQFLHPKQPCYSESARSSRDKPPPCRRPWKRSVPLPTTQSDPMQGGSFVAVFCL
jgi:hypothetical protein